MPVEILKKKPECEVCGPDECTCVKVSLEDLYALGALMIEFISGEAPFLEIQIDKSGGPHLSIDGSISLVEADVQVLKRMKVEVTTHDFD